MTEQDFLTAYYQIKAALDGLFEQFGLTQMTFFQQLILEAYLQNARCDTFAKAAIPRVTMEAETDDQSESSLDSLTEDESTGDKESDES